ncbi:MAG: hypothetical protein HON53_04400 [Planctomycetaceae bacterium]|nr:hypothetical protein [Planctomycetaceae bacterium]MBT6158010.1 hypothetical protein [Planctomycetaceae bacterium]MBT6484779.1 hypothetical protein [Planctomycetaceae bacterium]MBT6494124.1 hypothetical protein [Planctomycetaceae bacterium]
MASTLADGKSRLLRKIAGDLDHGGKQVLKPDSTGYKILARFVRRVSGKPDDGPAVADYDAPPFFDGVEMMPPQRLLRRITLSLAARLPTKDERAAVERDGLEAVNSILDSVMKDDAFYDRLQEAFNDILLVRGYDGGGEGALSYEHFKTRLWYQDRSPRKGLSPEKQRELFPYSHPKMIAYTKLVNDYREGMLREPLELIAHIVRNERPFTEIVTADYIMVSPYTARGYGVYDELQDKFNDPDDPFEFIPTKIKSLTDRNGRKVQESATGFFPHAGLLSSFQYLKRYPTTETNRNRLRVRMYFLHFLGIDLMQLAPRVNDAAAITAQYEIPTMQAADCVVCHKVMDPVAGLLQDYYVVDGKGIYGPRKDGWYKDMFAPGLENEGLPDNERWRSLQWLGERTAKDPRFPVAMVEHVWYILTGRKPLLPPEDIDDPLFSAKRRAYRVQRDETERIADVFVEADFNLKVAFKELVQSPYYRVDGLASTVNNPRRRAELDDVGLVRLLTPEQLERKLTAVFGQEWGRLTHRESKFKILYGGIDSKAVTERMTDPSGAMGAIQRIMSNDVACKNVALDFSREPSDRLLFPNIDLSVVPGGDAEAKARIRQAIVHLHQRLLGREHATDHPEVERTYELFAGIVGDAKAAKGLEKVGSYSCDRVDGKRLDDPNYTLRAWRGVVTYLLRQHDFLYE